MITFMFNSPCIAEAQSAQKENQKNKKKAPHSKEGIFRSHNLM